MEVDRFSEEAGTLMIRTPDNGLPEAGEPIDFDQGPFITWGLGPLGNAVRYYNFDVQSTTPAPIYAIVREGEDTPVEGQLNIVGTVPGDAEYNDFWRVHLVTVPADYVANTLTDAEQIFDAGLEVTETDTLVNCPIVPDGSSAALRLGGEEPGLHRGWYGGRIVHYFTFEEAPLSAASDSVPLSPIYVTFNVNPDEDGGGPASGFVMEPERLQTHNVIATVPGYDGYSPLWLVNAYDNVDFDDVHDLESASEANLLGQGVATVNCPVVSVGPVPVDPESAERPTIDRFSEEAATLMVRSADNGLPAAGEPIDFDQGPFITTGLGPAGQVVRYYNFDVQSTTPAPIYALVREGESAPVEGQLNIVGVVPGDAEYNDFWRVNVVTVPSDYVANITSVAELVDGNYPMSPTDTLVNCPIVPDGSTASLRLGGEDPSLHQGWYEGQVVHYFTFEEAPLAVSNDAVPVSPIYVTFNVNPGEAGGGPPSGFVTEPGSDQTHNVVATLPGEDGYSPLWVVEMYDNAEFDQVSDLESASAANILMSAAATVNCPVVELP